MLLYCCNNCKRKNEYIVMTLDFIVIRDTEDLTGRKHIVHRVIHYSHSPITTVTGCLGALRGFRLCRAPVRQIFHFQLFAALFRARFVRSTVFTRAVISTLNVVMQKTLIFRHNTSSRHDETAINAEIPENIAIIG